LEEEYSYYGMGLRGIKECRADKMVPNAVHKRVFNFEDISKKGKVFAKNCLSLWQARP
jgi:hypothetical protein